MSKLFKFFKLNSQFLSFFNVYLEGLLKMCQVKVLLMISGVSEGLFQADCFLLKLHIGDKLNRCLVTNANI